MNMYGFNSDFSSDTLMTHWRHTDTAGYQTVKYVFVKQEKKHS